MERQPASVPPEFLDEAATSMEQYEEETCSAAAGCVRFGSVILRRGCTFGKKAVVASAALISAPFVLPPLVFASAVSVVLSLPFGVYLVSMACTERLMKSLLPSPRALTYEPGDDFGAAKEEENDCISVKEGEAIKEQQVAVLVDGVDSGNETLGGGYEIRAGVRSNAVKTQGEESTDDSDDELFSDAYPRAVESASEKYEISMDGEDIGDAPSVYVVEQVTTGGEDGNEVQTEDEQDDPKKEEEMNDFGGSLEAEISKYASSDVVSVIGRSNAKVGVANFVQETEMWKANGGVHYSEAAAVCEEEPVVCVSMSLTPEEEEVSSFSVKNSIEKVDEVSAIEELVSVAERIKEEGMEAGSATEELVSVAERIKEEGMEAETIADRIASPKSKIAVILEKFIPMEELLLMKEYKEEEKIKDIAAIEAEILSFNAFPRDGRDLSSSNKLQEDEGTGTSDITLVGEEQVQIDIFASPLNKESILSPSNSTDAIANKVKPIEELISLGGRKEEEDIDEKKKQEKSTLSFKCLLIDDGCRSSTILQEHQGKTTIDEIQVEEEEKLDINIAASPESEQSLVSPHHSVDVISDKVNSTVELEEREKEEDTELDKGIDRTAFNNEKPHVTFMPKEVELKIQPSCLGLINPYTGDREKNSTETLQEDQVMRITKTARAEQRKEVDTEISVDIISDVNPMEELASILDSDKEEDTKQEKEMDKTAFNDEKPHFTFVPEEMEFKMQSSRLELIDPDTGDGEKDSSEILQEARVTRITETTQAEERKEVDTETPIDLICDMNEMEEILLLERKDEENIEEELRTYKAASETEICISTQAKERECAISYFSLNMNYPVADNMESNLCTQEKTAVEKSILVMDKEVVCPPKNQDAHNKTDHVAEVSFKYCGETDQSSISSEYVSAVEDLSADIAETESKSSVEHLLQKAEPVVAASSGETTVVPSDNMVPSQSQALYSEEQMWHQIAALRIILGYKATLSSSISEELKALYILTGLEPPDPFKDTTDLVDLSHKLLFLKVVIGVE